MTMSWQAGRQLESITQNGKTYNFTYAHDGLRTKKSITSGNTTVDVNYVYEGDKLLQMTYDNYVLTFSYDANGIPVSFHVKNATLDKDYYYGTNSRGDIEVIYNADGTLHARYDYDAYCQKYTFTTDVYLYSSKVIDLIVTEVAKDPTGIIDALIEKHKRISSTT